jgi:hypothetical protein
MTGPFFLKSRTMVLKRIYWRALLHRRQLHEKLDLLYLRARNRTSSSAVNGGQGPVVSLTTYGERLANVHLTIESIARGQLRPRRLILWLDDPRALSNLPPGLLRLERRGLEIRLSENFGPHTKYYPYLESEADFSVPLVTADDDIVYPPAWLAQLAAHHCRHPDDVVCHRARVIGFSGTELTPYNAWPYCGTTEASVRHFATGVSGVIYPVALQRILKQSGRRFVQCCPRQDDLWLHMSAIQAGFKIRQLSAESSEFPMLPDSQAQALHLTNVGEGQNDIQIRETYPRDVILLMQVAR